MIGERSVEGFTALTLASAAAGGIEAAFVPGAGMVGCSLRHRGEELLGQRRGLRAYAAQRLTMGIPLLHPWANRVSRRQFSVAGRPVDLDAVPGRLRLDDNGLAMHGLIAGASGWRVDRHQAAADGGVLTARLDLRADAELMAAFPIPHEVLLEVTLAAETLTVATTVVASGGVTVPIAFGFHPYLRLPGVHRADWEVAIPVSERLDLDAHMLPTGSTAAVDGPDGPLGSRTFDDAYVAPAGGAPFVLAGGGRRIELAFAAGYPYAQVFAPAEDDIVAFEPMTAPANALVSAGPALALLPPGERYRAAFTITVSGT